MLDRRASGLGGIALAPRKSTEVIPNLDLRPLLQRPKHDRADGGGAGPLDYRPDAAWRLVDRPVDPALQHRPGGPEVGDRLASAE